MKRFGIRPPLIRGLPCRVPAEASLLLHQSVPGFWDRHRFSSSFPPLLALPLFLFSPSFPAPVSAVFLCELFAPAYCGDRTRL